MIEETDWLPPTPLTLACEKRTPLTLATPSTLSTDLRTSCENGEKPSVFCTTSALLRLASIAPLMVALAPAAKIEAKVTSATPIISAAAVTAVRPGWRTEFSRAS